MASIQHKMNIGGDKQSTGPFGHIEFPSFEVTPHGMKCRLPIAEVDGITIAVLLIENDEGHIGLILHPAPDDEARDPTRKVYGVSWVFYMTNISRYNCTRLAILGNDLYNLRFRGRPVNASWRDIYILTHPRTVDQLDGASLILRLVPDFAPAPFRIPRWLLHAMTSLKLFVATRAVQPQPGEKTSMQVEFSNMITGEEIRIGLGLCTQVPAGAFPDHWAWAEAISNETWLNPWGKGAHDCATDHIEDWPQRSREFGSPGRTIRLSFAPCPHSPDQTLVLGIELSGAVYEDMQHAAGVSLSSRLLLTPQVNDMALSESSVHSQNRTGAHVCSPGDVQSSSAQPAPVPFQVDLLAPASSTILGTPPTGRSSSHPGICTEFEWFPPFQYLSTSPDRGHLANGHDQAIREGLDSQDYSPYDGTGVQYMRPGAVLAVGPIVGFPGAPEVPQSPPDSDKLELVSLPVAALAKCCETCGGDAVRSSSTGTSTMTTTKVSSSDVDRGVRGSFWSRLKRCFSKLRCR